MFKSGAVLLTLTPDTKPTARNHPDQYQQPTNPRSASQLDDQPTDRATNQPTNNPTHGTTRTLLEEPYVMSEEDSRIERTMAALDFER